MSIKTRLTLLAASLALTLSAPHAFAEPHEIKDDRGQVIKLQKDASRVASISYFGADVALAVGAKPVASTFMVQGRNPDYLADAMGKLPNLGQRATPNLELISQAKPDLIVAIRRYTEANAAKLSQIAPYAAFDLETFEDIDPSIVRVAELLGKKAEAEKLNAQFAADLKAFAAKAPKGKPVKYLFMWGGGEAPWTFYNEHPASTILNKLGAVNAAGGNPTPKVKDNTAFEMNLEAMLAADPDVIFVYDYGPARPFETNPIWKQLRAVKNNRVVYVKDHWVEPHGPIAREVLLREAANLLYPQTFPKVDPKQVAKQVIQG